jgi:hypothetical protein
MTISTEDPRWLALARELANLATASGTDNAVVADTSQNLWCRAFELSTHDAINLVTPLWEKAMETLSKASSIDCALESSPPAWARSFGGSYLLLLWASERLDEARVARSVESRIGRIAELTADLPPDDGGPLAASNAEQ